MTVGAEALTRRDAIFIEHPQRAEFDVLLVEIFGERKAVVRIEPAMIGVTAFFAASCDFHGNTLYRTHEGQHET